MVVPTTVTVETITPEVTSSPYLLFARNDNLWRSDLQGTAVEQLTTDGLLNWGMGQGDEWRLAASSRPPRVSPDGRVIAVPTNEGLWLLDLAQGRQLEITSEAVGPAGVTWSPDATQLAYAEGSGRLYVYDLKEQPAGPRLLLETANLTHIVWSPDNQHIAIGCCLEQAGEGGQSSGQIQRIDILSEQTETVGTFWSSIAGGSPPLCWFNDRDVGQVELAAIRSSACSYAPVLAPLSPDGRLQAFLEPASLEDAFWTGPSRLTIVSKEDEHGDLPVAKRELAENIKVVKWSPDSAILFLDDHQSQSPIWYLPFGVEVEGPAVVIENGYLLDVVSGAGMVPAGLPAPTPSNTPTPTPSPTATATPQATLTPCPDLPDGDLVGTTTQAGSEITYANPVLGVELTYPGILSLHEDQYLSGAYGFTIMPAGEEEAMFRVSWLHEYRPDQLETRVQEVIDAAPTIDIQRSDTTVGGQPAVALANAPSRAAALYIYVAANDKLYEIIYNVEVLDEQFDAILESIRFFEATLPLDCLDLPPA